MTFSRFAHVATIALATLAIGASSAAAQGDVSDAGPVTGPLSDLAVLTGIWSARGTGFSTTLTYSWLLRGAVMEVINEVRTGNDSVSARYRGMYTWDRGRNEIAFFTAAQSGEVHRGRAWWSEGVIWHEAEVSGGSIASYASAVRPGDRRIEFFAAYGSSRAERSLLDSQPLVYERVAATAPAAGTQASERVVTDYIDAYNRHDVPGMLALADPGVTWLSVVKDSVQLEVRGAGALQQSLSEYFTSLPSARSTVEGMVSLGPWVTVRERAHWLAASGPRSQAALAIYEVRDGRIRRVWYYPTVRPADEGEQSAGRK